MCNIYLYLFFIMTKITNKTELEQLLPWKKIKQVIPDVVLLGNARLLLFLLLANIC